MTTTIRNEIAANIANALRALNVADKKLGRAITQYDDECLSDRADLLSAQLNVRIFACIMQNEGVPSLPARVFRDIAKYENKHPKNSPHEESAILALRLAERSLEAALDAASEFDGQAVDRRYEVAYAALGTVNQWRCTLECAAYVFHADAVLDAIIAGPGARRRRTAAA